MSLKLVRNVSPAAVRPTAGYVTLLWKLWTIFESDDALFGTDVRPILENFISDALISATIRYFVLAGSWHYVGVHIRR